MVAGANRVRRSDSKETIAVQRRAAALPYENVNSAMRDCTSASAQSHSDNPCPTRMGRDADLSRPAPREARHGTVTGVVVHDERAALPVPIKRTFRPTRGLTGVARIERRAVRLCGRHGAVGPLPLNRGAVPRLVLGAANLGGEQDGGAAGAELGERNRRRDAESKRGLGRLGCQKGK